MGSSPRTAASVILPLMILPATITLGAEYEASSAADVARLCPGLKSGDTLVLADGTWSDQRIAVRAEGTAEQPITVRARTPGKVVVTGASSLVVDGRHVVVSGLHFKDGRGGKDCIAVAGSHCRLTECAVVGGDYKFFVHLIGTDNRVDHCYLAEKTSGDPTLQVEVGEQPDNDRIDHNHFGHRPPLGRNGGETIRVGYSGQSMRNSRAVVESNLFDRCDGELEIISSKSCENVYRHNTFLDCAGTLTLRHGNRCTVESNFFLAHHKRESGGIRVIGEDHRIVNNYLDGVDKGAFWITSGVPDSKLNQYFQAKNCTIAFNTVVDSAGPYLDLSAGLGTSGRTLKPERITIANNVLALGERGQLLKGSEGDGWRWAGNFAGGGRAAAGEGHAGVKIADLKLQRGADGIWRPAADSPVRGAAEADIVTVKEDIEGQPRTGKADAGSDQVSDAPVAHRPLTAADVGPAWMPRTAGDKTAAGK